ETVRRLLHLRGSDGRSGTVRCAAARRAGGIRTRGAPRWDERRDHVPVRFGHAQSVARGHRWRVVHGWPVQGRMDPDGDGPAAVWIAQLDVALDENGLDPART